MEASDTKVVPLVGRRGEPRGRRGAGGRNNAGSAGPGLVEPEKFVKPCKEKAFARRDSNFR